MKPTILTKAKLVSLLFLGLAACDDPPQARSEADVRRIALDAEANRFLQLELRLDSLEGQLKVQQAELDTTSKFVTDTFNAHESLRKVVNHNVDLDNQAAVRAMTARGACGTDLVHLPDGGWYNRPRECTLKDLRQ